MSLQSLQLPIAIRQGAFDWLSRRSTAQVVSHGGAPIYEVPPYFDFVCGMLAVSVTGLIRPETPVGTPYQQLR